MEGEVVERSGSDRQFERVGGDGVGMDRTGSLIGMERKGMEGVGRLSGN